jgi:hypothetical protein
MLQAFFHAWERQLASVSKDRVVRPFEWGLDWIPQNGLPHGTPPEQVLERRKRQRAVAVGQSTRPAEARPVWIV